MLNVSVVYPLENVQRIFKLQVAADCSVIRAIKKSGVLEAYPEIDLHALTVGIYGVKTTLDAALHPNDRIEIYRPLRIEPMQARRLRAARKRAYGLRTVP